MNRTSRGNAGSARTAARHARSPPAKWAKTQTDSRFIVISAA
jgi:hypothetical protein